MHFRVTTRRKVTRECKEQYLPRFPFATPSGPLATSGCYGQATAHGLEPGARKRAQFDAGVGVSPRNLSMGPTLGWAPSQAL